MVRVRTTTPVSTTTVTTTTVPTTTDTTTTTTTPTTTTPTTTDFDHDHDDSDHGDADAQPGVVPPLHVTRRPARSGRLPSSTRSRRRTAIGLDAKDGVVQATRWNGPAASGPAPQDLRKPLMIVAYAGPGVGAADGVFQALAASQRIHHRVCRRNPPDRHGRPVRAPDRLADSSSPSPVDVRGQRHQHLRDDIPSDRGSDAQADRLLRCCTVRERRPEQGVRRRCPRKAASQRWTRSATRERPGTSTAAGSPATIRSHLTRPGRSRHRRTAPRSSVVRSRGAEGTGVGSTRPRAEHEHLTRVRGRRRRRNALRRERSAASYLPEHGRCGREGSLVVQRVAGRRATRTLSLPQPLQAQNAMYGRRIGCSVNSPLTDVTYGSGLLHKKVFVGCARTQVSRLRP